MYNGFTPFAPSGGEHGQQMQKTEDHYVLEQALMEAVSKGQLQRALELLARIPVAADPVRKGKNHCIVLNTLLRKAAQQGGVQPVVLAPAVDAFAKRIEDIHNLSSAVALTEEMVRTYCRLVSENATGNYSPLVQRAIACIDSDLTAELSLRSLAKTLNVSSSYLSTRFKKETGQTLTGYINGRRIAYAMQLLQTTSLQVQMVAQHCGITDVHYFSKLFKRFTGKTPREFRDGFRSKQ